MYFSPSSCYFFSISPFNLFSYSERPSSAPIKKTEDKILCNSGYFCLYDCRQEIGRLNILNWMVLSVLQAWPVLNLFVNAILIVTAVSKYLIVITHSKDLWATVIITETVFFFFFFFFLPPPLNKLSRSASLRRWVTIPNMLLYFYDDLPNQQAGGPLLIDRQRKVIQYHHSYSPYQDQFATTSMEKHEICKSKLKSRISKWIWHMRQVLLYALGHESDYSFGLLIYTWIRHASWKPVSGTWHKKIMKTKNSYTDSKCTTQIRVESDSYSPMLVPRKW